MNKFDELKAAAEIAEPIFTDLYGDRYMQGSWSRVDLTQTQDAFVALATPAAILELLTIRAQLVGALSHPALYELLGNVEDSMDSSTWSKAVVFMEARDAALAAAGEQP